MNERLKKQLRVVAAFWLAGVLALACLTLRDTDGKGVSPLSLLLRAPEPPAPQLLAESTLPAPPTPPVPEPEPVPVIAIPEMPRGKKPGNGVLAAPLVETLPDGSVAVTFPLEGSSGEYTAFSLSAFSRSVDLHGRFKTSRLRVHPKGVARLIQVENHNSHVRVSATRVDTAKPLKEHVTLPPGSIRIVFSENK